MYPYLKESELADVEHFPDMPPIERHDRVIRQRSALQKLSSLQQRQRVATQVLLIDSFDNLRVLQRSLPLSD